MLEQFKVKPEDAVRVREENLRATVESVFRKMGLPEEDCSLGADVLVKADMRGVDTHGVSNMLRSYVTGYGSGEINPSPNWQINRANAEPQPQSAPFPRQDAQAQQAKAWARATTSGAGTSDPLAGA